MGRGALGQLVLGYSCFAFGGSKSHALEAMDLRRQPISPNSRPRVILEASGDRQVKVQPPVAWSVQQTEPSAALPPHICLAGTNVDGRTQLSCLHRPLDASLWESCPIVPRGGPPGWAWACLGALGSPSSWPECNSPCGWRDGNRPVTCALVHRPTMRSSSMSRSLPRRRGRGPLELPLRARSDTATRSQSPSS